MKNLDKKHYSKIYLREIQSSVKWESPQLSIFEGDIKSDKKYWEDQGYKVRYFEVKEVDFSYKLRIPYNNKFYRF